MTTDRMKQLEKLLAAEPNDVFCLYGLAMEHAKSGAAAEALRYFDQVIAADPGYCYAYFHKAKVLEAQGEIENAVSTLRTGLSRAQMRHDSQAVNEISAFLDELT
ncbi:MAG TPA: tetratricopeptide repeat protein [Phycisphaerales bacterium]|nr:tetratricopeptide repeat protein [Phycisphaerales bacterium]